MAHIHRPVCQHWHWLHSLASGFSWFNIASLLRGTRPVASSARRPSLSLLWQGVVSIVRSSSSFAWRVHVGWKVARSEHTSPPTRGGEVCSAKCPCRYGAGTVASHSGTASSGPRCRGPARLGSPGQALAGCISYDGGELRAVRRHRVPSCSPLGRVRKGYLSKRVASSGRWRWHCSGADVDLVALAHPAKPRHPVLTGNPTCRCPPAFVPHVGCCAARSSR